MTADELQTLVSLMTPERIDLEFKAAPYADDTASKKEALKDISAFANTQGGTLIIGVKEDAGRASRLQPISPKDAEVEMQRLEQLVQMGIEPRLFGVEFNPIQIGEGVIIAISVPRSANAPHRVIAQGTNKFYLRSTTNVYEANVQDLRRLFSQYAELRARSESFHNDRLAAFAKGQFPVPLIAERGLVAIHVIPACAFDSPVNIDVKQAHAEHLKFPPLHLYGMSPRYVVEGFANIRGGDKPDSYTLVNRNGIVEALGAKIVIENEGRRYMHLRAMERTIIEGVANYAQGLLYLGLNPPFQVAVSFQGLGGITMVGGQRDLIFDDATILLLANLSLPLVTLEDIGTVEKVAVGVKPCIDALWNAGGYPESPSFSTGVWVAPPV